MMPRLTASNAPTAAKSLSGTRFSSQALQLPSQAGGVQLAPKVAGSIIAYAPAQGRMGAIPEPAPPSLPSAAFTPKGAIATARGGVSTQRPAGLIASARFGF